MFDQLLEVQVFTPGHEVRQGYDETVTALDDLDAALDALQVVPLGDDVLVRTPHADVTLELMCTGAATCNVKCEPTGYWDCQYSAQGSCQETCNGDYTCIGDACGGPTAASC
ncbi:MAG TPA: hypothetical protein VEX86_22690 [Longimicrobium sp.]|nr:hypothetical protein [Longimicrobium sp.]